MQRISGISNSSSSTLVKMQQVMATASKKKDNHPVVAMTAS